MLVKLFVSLTEDPNSQIDIQINFTEATRSEAKNTES